MEQQSNIQKSPVLCRSGCGFYGNPSTDGHCSVCFKKVVQTKEPASSPTIVNSGSAEPCNISASANIDSVLSNCVAPITTTECETTSAQSRLSTVQSSSDPSPSGKKTNRCTSCRKRVGLTGFECRCGGLYCAIHRYSDKHSCTFNYRELGAEEIRRANPVILGEKIRKI